MVGESSDQVIFSFSSFKYFQGILQTITSWMQQEKDCPVWWGSNVWQTNYWKTWGITDTGGSVAKHIFFFIFVMIETVDAPWLPLCQRLLWLIHIQIVHVKERRNCSYISYFLFYLFLFFSVTQISKKWSIFCLLVNPNYVILRMCHVILVFIPSHLSGCEYKQGISTGQKLIGQDEAQGWL